MKEQALKEQIHLFARVTFILFAFTAFVVFGFVFTRDTKAQQNTPGWNGNRPPATPRPTRKPPVVHPTPVHRPTPTTPLLAVEYRMFKINDDGTEVDVSPLTVFHKGDHLGIAMRSDQNVYLYVLKQSSPTASGQLFFPDSRINNGQNYLEKNNVIVAPAKCSPGISTETCSYTVDGDVGREVFTMIFTKNPSVRLLESPTGSVSSEVSADTLKAYMDSLNERLTSSVNPRTHFMRVTNTNAHGNDKIVVSVPLNKGG